METSILKSVKKVLGIAADYTAFDEDILIHINSAFTTLNQLGIGPAAGFSIEDDSIDWDTYLQGDEKLNSVKSYISLKVRMAFDPPATSFTQSAIQEQIKELEWRLSMKREGESWVAPTPPPVETEVIIIPSNQAWTAEPA